MSRRTPRPERVRMQSGYYVDLEDRVQRTYDQQQSSRRSLQKQGDVTRVVIESGRQRHDYCDYPEARPVPIPIRAAGLGRAALASSPQRRQRRSRSRSHSRSRSRSRSRSPPRRGHAGIASRANVHIYNNEGYPESANLRFEIPRLRDDPYNNNYETEEVDNWVVQDFWPVSDVGSDSEYSFTLVDKAENISQTSSGNTLTTIATNGNQHDISKEPEKEMVFKSDEINVFPTKYEFVYDSFEKMKASILVDENTSNVESRAEPNTQRKSSSSSNSPLFKWL